MCEIVKGQRRAFRDQDPPRIRDRSKENVKTELEFSKSTPNLPIVTQGASSFEKCSSEPEFLKKDLSTQGSTSSDSIRVLDNVKVVETVDQPDVPNRMSSEHFLKELADKVPSSGRHDNEVCCIIF